MKANKGAKGKVQSVLELAKWHPGDRPYYITLMNNPKVKWNSIGEDWMFDHDVHPKVLYDRRVVESKDSREMPRTDSGSFMALSELLSSDLCLSRFHVHDLHRCPNTGEFVYVNFDGEYMPESCLFANVKEAKKEASRIIEMIQSWVMENRTPKHLR